MWESLWRSKTSPHIRVACEASWRPMLPSGIPKQGCLTLENKTAEATPEKAGSVHDRRAESEGKTLLNTCRCSRFPFKNTFSSISCQIPSLLVGAGTTDWPQALRHPLLFLLITRVFMALLSIPGTLLSPVEMMSYRYLGWWQLFQFLEVP